MRIRGFFLRSRVARRTFWVLLAAALLPLALFALVAGQAYLAERDARQHRDETEYLKHIGLRAFDRLVAARATLAAHAADGRFDAPSLPGASGHRVLARLATLTGDRSHGDAALAADWRRAGGDGLDGTRELWWLPLRDGQPARVILEWHDTRGRGLWLAEVAPEFLWADFEPDGPAAALCLQDAGRNPLRCARPAEAGAPEWRLFMRGAFDSPDWLVAGRRADAGIATQDDVLELLLLAGGATLLLITSLGLILVRRTMVPLEQLTAGTRRLAGGDWSVRVDDARGDEFGQLARQFNAMVEGQHRQLEAMTVQAAIDRELLGEVDLPRVMQQVVSRLQALAPGAGVAVVAQSVDGRDWQLHRPGLPATACEGPPETLQREPEADAWMTPRCGQAEAPPDWVRVALGQPPSAPAAVCAVPARWQGETVAVLLQCTACRTTLEEGTRREVAQLRDRCALAVATARREHRLVERAVRDELTGLLNRHGLHDACEEWLAGPGGPRDFAVLFVDLDGFKEINDSLGHSAGDLLLRAVTERLRALLPAGAVLARPGGDEFVALLPDDGPAPGGDGGAEALAQTVCRRLAQPFVVCGQLQHIGASVGLAVCPQDGTDREELLRRADLAMYAAKAEGRGRCRRYADTLDREASERTWMLRDLRAAVGEGALEVHFQPRLELGSGRICSAEALVRWRHPQHGWIPPLRFVPLSEQSDLILVLGRQVMSLAMTQFRRWRTEGLRVGRVAVNVSARQLHEPLFADETLALLARHGLRPQDLEIEITESLFAGDPTAVTRALAPLRAHGVVVALDDFGTGFSSLGALARLPVDVMKIDRSFVIDLGQGTAADAVVRSVIALARDLDMRVVAEGVETRAQEQRLLALGCDEVQGYRYAKPLAPDAFVEGARAGFGATLGTEEAARVPEMLAS
ncbi:MAG: EAL domain-containing protein [Burkholderiaceae bacterium]